MVVLKFKSNYKEEVMLLQSRLSSKGYTLDIDGDFGEKTLDKVKEFQKNHELEPDGIVGFNTWSELLINCNYKLHETDYHDAAFLLSCDVATIKAVVEVESGALGGFIETEKPVILFEGHIFWSCLKSKGINPYTYTRGNEDILYKSWTKQHYKGGIKEYTRLQKAIDIDKESALKSASWGLFQIMGNNYKSCGCRDVFEFVELMSKGESSQLILFVKFINNNGLTKYLRNNDWRNFAKRYNGPRYYENKYDEKLKIAYQKYKNNGRR